MTPKPAQDKPAGKVKLTEERTEILGRMYVGWILRQRFNNSNHGMIGDDFVDARDIRFFLRRKLIMRASTKPYIRYFRITAKGRRALKESSK